MDDDFFPKRYLAWINGDCFRATCRLTEEALTDIPIYKLIKFKTPDRMIKYFVSKAVNATDAVILTDWKEAKVSIDAIAPLYPFLKVVPIVFNCVIG